MVLTNDLYMSLENLELWDYSTWPFWFAVAFAAVIALGVEILSFFVLHAFAFAPPIAIKGKHLDVLETLDVAFIYFNRLSMVPFMYHVIQVVYYTPTILLRHEEATLMNTAGSLIAFFVFYDFFYHQFHKLLHVRALYPLVHKHHHRQKAPSRGNIDAINVHPFEFLSGEYLHILTIYVIPCHLYAVMIFIAIGGVLASLNHTRYDINIPGIYSVKYHDIHHRLPETNYSQYTMLWDHIWNTYRPYNTSIGFIDKDGTKTSCPHESSRCGDCNER